MSHDAGVIEFVEYVRLLFGRSYALVALGCNRHFERPRPPSSGGQRVSLVVISHS